jgi:hypothetical protein
LRPEDEAAGERPEPDDEEPSAADAVARPDIA